MRYELTDLEWAAIKSFLPNKPRGIPPVDDRRVLNGIFWVLRSGAPWRDLPVSYGSRTTCYNRFVRWRRAGVWDRTMDALAAGHDAAVQMIDTSIALSPDTRKILEAMGYRFEDCEPTNHVAAIIVGSPSLGGKPVGRNRYYGANDPRGGTGLAAGY